MQIKLFPFCLFAEVKHVWFRSLHPVYDTFSSCHEPGSGWDGDNTKKQRHKKNLACDERCRRWKEQKKREEFQTQVVSVGVCHRKECLGYSELQTLRGLMYTDCFFLSQPVWKIQATIYGIGSLTLDRF